MLEDGEDELQAGLVSEKKKGISPTGKVAWASAMLLSGTCTTLFAKALFETKAHGSDQCYMHDDDDDDNNLTKRCTFDKPWFSVLLMKLAMTMCLPLYYGFGWGKSEGAQAPSLDTIKRVYLPSGLDLLNTILGNVGLLWVSSSIYQMTRGSVVIFSAFLSVRWLGKKLQNFHYFAIFFVIVAVALVGLAGTLSSDDESSGAGMVILGLGFIVAAQAVTAVQFIVEEEFMNEHKADRLDPVALVGFEGLWGLAYFAVLAPYLTYTPDQGPRPEPISILWHEDFNDTFVQISNSTPIAILCLGYFVTILMYNVSANVVTNCLSAVVRSILEACRTLGVWIVGLLLYYIFKSNAVGEKWNVPWSFLELFGFFVLLLGTFSYKALVKLPCVDPESYEQAIRDDEEYEKRQKQKADNAQYNTVNDGGSRAYSSDKYQFLADNGNNSTW